MKTETFTKESRPEQRDPAPNNAGQSMYHAVVGLDVGDRTTRFCIVDLDGELISEGTLPTRTAAVRLQFQGGLRLRIAMEAGVHSSWLSRLLNDLGHEVIVANARSLRLISDSDSKNDRADARMLARLARVGPDLLSPIKHRDPAVQDDLAIIRAREVAVTARTKLINAVRALVKQTGDRFPSSPASTFAQKAEQSCPESLKPALLPLIRMIERLTEEIKLYDKMVASKAEKQYPATKIIRTIPGVGSLTALAFVLVLNNDPHRFRKSRDVGCYLGLRPQQRESGDRSPQLGITKAGDRVLRRIVVQSAQYILGPFGKDCALRRWGIHLGMHGGSNGKKRAVIAVARKLVILMHRLWVANEAFDPARGIAAPQAA